MRRLLVRMLPKIIATVCWAHQINLVFGEYISLPGIREWVELALDIIKWFNAHSTALDLLREEQRITPPNQVLSLLLPVSTRWTSHYLSISRLLQVKQALQALCIRMGAQLRLAAGPKREQVSKAEEIIALIKREDIWTQLAL